MSELVDGRLPEDEIDSPLYDYNHGLPSNPEFERKLALRQERLRVREQERLFFGRLDELGRSARKRAEREAAKGRAEESVRWMRLANAAEDRRLLVDATNYETLDFVKGLAPEARRRGVAIDRRPKGMGLGYQAGSGGAA